MASTPGGDPASYVPNSDDEKSSQAGLLQDYFGHGIQRAPASKDSAVTSSGGVQLVRDLSYDGDMQHPGEGGVVRVRLEYDCYAVSVVSGVPLWAALALPMASAALQITVLHFMAFTNDNLFDEGRWLTPISSHSALNVMKCISVAVSLFKVSTELSHAQQLYRAMMVGDFGGGMQHITGWCALALQYTMAMTVLFVSMSVVLACQSATACITKIFTVFVIVDMDNLMARFVGVIWSLRFSVIASPDLMESERLRRKQVGDFSVRFCFVILPITLIFLEGCVALITNSPPLTIVRHGYVSNVDAPRMLVNEGSCCPPQMATISEADMLFNFSVLLVGPAAAPPPVVFWTAIESQKELKPPSSLQVIEGRDSDGNSAVLAGRTMATPVQAGYWLQSHGFDAEAYTKVDHIAVLYRQTLPYEATWQPDAMPSAGATYRIYVAAQNPQTKALSPEPAVSELLATSVCPQHCESCDVSGPQHCDVCAAGTHRTLVGMCAPCPDLCTKCDAQAGAQELLLRKSSHLPCDLGGCNKGYGVRGDGTCGECSVEGCTMCDGDTSICLRCADGYGLGPNHACEACAHEQCQCTQAGGCDFCSPGWGLLSNRSCAECKQGCAECTTADDDSGCITCKPGFALQDRSCHRCPQHCVQCNTTGVENCDHCLPGYGVHEQTGKCMHCVDDNCERCTGEQPWRCQQCRDGYGLTLDSRCDTCGSFCEQCDSVGTCRRCQQGYADVKGVCWRCADGCESCSHAGPARCDRCFAGFRLINTTRTCIPLGLEKELSYV